MADADRPTGWQQDLQRLHDALMNQCEQIEAWFEEMFLLEAEIQGERESEEIRQCVADIKTDLQHYRELIKQIPNEADFSAEEIENTSGQASLLIDIAGEFTLMGIYLPRKVEKLRFLLKHHSH